MPNTVGRAGPRVSVLDRDGNVVYFNIPSDTAIAIAWHCKCLGHKGIPYNTMHEEPIYDEAPCQTD